MVPERQGSSLSAGVENLPPRQLDSSLSLDEESLIAQVAPGGELRRQVLLALDFNRDARLSGLRVLEARAMFGMTRADGSPTLAVGLERNRQHFDNTTVDERYGQDLSVASIGASNFELDFFGRVKNLSEAARHEYLASAWGQQAARSALFVEVVRAYLLQQLTGAVQADAQRIDEARQSLLQMAQEQLRQGALSADELAQQKVEALRSHQQLVAAIADHSRASQALLFLGGYHGMTVTPQPSMPSESVALESETPAWLADMPSERLLQRFDVRQSEELLKAAHANIGAARAAFFPIIRLSTGIGVASDSLGQLLNAGSGTWLFSPQMTLPLFDGGRNRANLDLAEVRRQIAVAQYQKTVQTAFREVADVLIQRRQALERVHSEAQLRTLADEKARRLGAAMAAGSADHRELALSTIHLAQADTTWRKSRHALLLNHLNLYRVLSGTDAAVPESHPDTGA